MSNADPTHGVGFNNAPPYRPKYPKEIDPLVLSKRRGIFSPGQRIRMNIVPMFISLILPWGIFIYCAGITSFNVMYFHPNIGIFLLCIPLVLWVIFCIYTYFMRKRASDPTWYVYIAIMVAIFGIWGVCTGMSNFRMYSAPFLKIMSLRDLRGGMNGLDKRGIDASRTRGTDVMDAGIFVFGPKNHFDEAKSWHFKDRSLFCVVPIISNHNVPTSQEYDFWAVGKDCCSDSASDFRCSAWKSDHVKTGIRVLNEADSEYYKLAVKQAESVYNIRAPHPIFMTMYGGEYGSEYGSGSGSGSGSGFELDLNMGWNMVNSWTQIAWKNYVIDVVFSLIVSLFSLTLALIRFSYLGRSPSAPTPQLQ